MDRQEWIRELSEEIKDLEQLLAKAEKDNDMEGRWVVYLLRSLLKRRLQALMNVRLMDITLH